MAIGARVRKKLAAIDDMSDALRGDGCEEAAMALVSALPLSTHEASGDDSWRLAARAVERGWPRVAALMIQEDRAAGMDREAALEIACEADQMASFDAFSQGSGRYELLRCAYKAMSARRGGSSALVHGEVYRAAIHRAGLLREAEWAGARAEGLDKLWAARPRLAYEEACEHWGAPLWSANAAPAIGAEADRHRDLHAGGPALHGVESMAHHSSALGLPEETLLWSKQDVAALVAEDARRAGNPAWRSDLLRPMVESWELACEYLPRAADLMAKGRKDATGAIAAKLAREVSEMGIGRWAPFILAWAEHGPFGQDEAKRFEPVLRACVIDASNAGLVAANIDYGSFNARMAVIATKARQVGSMDDAATAMVAARLDDLAADPELRARFADPRFGPELRDALAFFGSEACRVAMESEIPEDGLQKSARPRGL